MAIVNKNFRVKNGLIVDGSVATVNGYNVLTEASTAFIISTVGGSADTANTPNTVVKRDGSGNFAAGTITANIVGNLTGNVTGTVSSLSNHNTGDLAEGSNLYFTNARALAATAAAYDAAGAASSAQANAATDATAKVAAEATARATAVTNAIATAAADATTKSDAARVAAISAAATDATTKANAAQTAAISAAATDATTKANAAQSAAQSFATSADTTLHTAVTSEIATAKSEAITSAGTYTDGKISALINGAPTILDTLKEIADALTADEGTAATLATTVSGKVSKAGDTMSGNLAMGTNKVTGLGTPTAGTDATTKDYVDTANTNQSTTLTSAIATAKSEAISTAATDATSKVAAEATARNSAISSAISGEVTDRNSAIATAKSEAISSANTTQAAANTAQLNGTTAFTVVNVNDVAAVRAATTTVASAGTVNALTWSGSDYRTAKALVKFKNGVNTQVSEVLLTLDTSNNVAITEFGSITTGTDLGTVSAAYASGSVSISVTTTYASTDVMVYATLIK